MQPRNNTAQPRRRMARFNRLFANKVAGPLLTRHSAFGVVEHRGRKSGRQYRTPVKLFRRGANYVITLPYGSECDWVRNVRAADGCILLIKNARIQASNPTLVDLDGEVAMPAAIRWVLRRLNVGECLQLSPVDAGGIRTAR